MIRFVDGHRFGKVLLCTNLQHSQLHVLSRAKPTPIGVLPKAEPRRFHADMAQMSTGLSLLRNLLAFKKVLVNASHASNSAEAAKMTN